MSNYYLTRLDMLEKQTMTKAEALDYLQHHGINSFDTQTGYCCGEPSLYGTSFAEQVGIKKIYTVKEVKRWLGY